jgi:calcineurin-like phosphoesterase family protein
MRFFTSDTHFGHYNVIRYCNRPFNDKYEMDRVLIENWNKTIKPEDTVYHLGDVSFYGKDESARILSLLNGYKIVIRGNHDRGPNGLKTMGFNEVYDNLKLTLSNGREVNLSHYPYKEHYTEDPHTKNKHLFKNLSDDGKLLINGHVHEKWKNRNRMINVGVDVWNFTPVSEDELIKFITDNGI